MAILVDYSCSGCGARHEVWVERPIPAERSCPVCGSVTRRRFNGALLRGAASPPAAAPATSTGPSLCQRYPDVPGLCHMTPAAARGWIARARKDNRALEREIARQERAVADGVLDPSRASVTHGHGHGHGHAGTAVAAAAQSAGMLSS